MTEIEDLTVRADTALEGISEVVYSVRFAPVTGDVICAALAIAGRPGIFVGYGTSDTSAQVDAWRNFRDRAGHGYKVVSSEERARTTG